MSLSEIFWFWKVHPLCIKMLSVIWLTVIISFYRVECTQVFISSYVERIQNMLCIICPIYPKNKTFIRVIFLTSFITNLCFKNIFKRLIFVLDQYYIDIKHNSRNIIKPHLPITWLTKYQLVRNASKIRRTLQIP